MNLDNYFQWQQLFSRQNFTKEMWTFLLDMQYCLDIGDIVDDGVVSSDSMNLRDLHRGSWDCIKARLITSKADRTTTFPVSLYSLTFKGMWYITTKEAMDEFYYSLDFSIQRDIDQWLKKENIYRF